MLYRKMIKIFKVDSRSLEKEKEKVLYVEGTWNGNEIFSVQGKILLLPPRSQHHINKSLTSASHNWDNTSRQTARQTHQADRPSGTVHYNMAKCRTCPQHT
ncbi:hypothetical protein F4703DRAFT_1797916 [Phycomyces blakesleeanus]